MQNLKSLDQCLKKEFTKKVAMEEFWFSFSIHIFCVFISFFSMVLISVIEPQFMKSGASFVHLHVRVQPDTNWLLWFSSPAGLWFPGVTAVWHAAGDEGAVRRNPAQEMEHHLQVVFTERRPTAAVCVAEAENDWESAAVCMFRRSFCFSVAEDMLVSACRADLPLSSHKVIRGHLVCGTTTHTLTHQRWFVGNFPVLVLKFYDQPERGSVLKQTSGTFSTLQSG